MSIEYFIIAMDDSCTKKDVLSAFEPYWKKLEKEFHIDYVFGSEKIYKNLQNMEIGQYDNWIDVSDHMPMILNMNAE